jgi:hypothetical protein
VTAKGGNTARKYLSTHVTLGLMALGAVMAAHVLYPGARGVLGPLAFVIGGAIGYRLRDAVGDYRGARALERLRKQHGAAKRDAVNELLARVQAGVIDPADARPGWVQAAAAAADQNTQEATNGN